MESAGGSEEPQWSLLGPRLEQGDSGSAPKGRLNSAPLIGLRAALCSAFGL